MPYQDVQTLARRFPDVVWGDVAKADVNTGKGCAGRYAETVRMLLEKHFGPAMPSLTIDASPRQSANTLFFLTLPPERLAAIRAFRDALNAMPEAAKSGISELIWPDDSKPKSLQKKALRVARFQLNTQHWSASFCALEGVRFHKSYGGKFAATLLVSNHKRQHVWLASDMPANRCFGLWNGPQEGAFFYPDRDEGMNYNKFLLLGGPFRNFVVDFLGVIAETERKWILRDAAKTIQRCGCFLPQISYPDFIKNYHRPGDVIKAALPDPAHNPFHNKNLNTYDLNTGYVAALLSGTVDPRDNNALSRLSPETIQHVITPGILELGIAGEGITAFLDRYAALKIHDSPAFDLNYAGCLMLARDYFSMCEDMHIPKRFFDDNDENGEDAGEEYLRAHNELAEAQREAEAEEDNRPLVVSPSRFDALEEALSRALPEECKRITTLPELRLEGQKQHNCVFSRQRYLREDEAAIFHWDPADDEGRHYTVQFGIQPKTSGFYIEEMKDRFNNEPLPEHIQLLRDTLREINKAEA